MTLVNMYTNNNELVTVDDLHVEICNRCKYNKAITNTTNREKQFGDSTLVQTADKIWDCICKESKDLKIDTYKDIKTLTRCSCFEEV